MVRGPSAVWAVCYGICLSLLLSQCHCQLYEPYEKIPLTSFKSWNGTFGFPSGETQIFDEGTPMTIRWSTDFVAVNLYLVQNVSVYPPSLGTQRQLSTGYSKRTFDLVLACDPNCDAPFSIKAVDSFGDLVAQTEKGFWSRQFWIRPTKATTSIAQKSSATSSTSTTMSSTSSASTSTTSPATLTSGSLSTSAPTSASTSAAIAAPNAEPTIASPSTSPSIPTSEPELASNSDTGPSTNTTAIGASVGAAVAVVLIMCGAFYLWKRLGRRKARNDQPTEISSDALYSSPLQDRKVPINNHYPVFEAPGWQVAEVPGWQVEPQELPGRPV